MAGVKFSERKRVSVESGPFEVAVSDDGRVEISTRNGNIACTRDELRNLYDAIDVLMERGFLGERSQR